MSAGSSKSQTVAVGYSQSRRRAGIALISLAGIVLAASALAMYVQRNIFEPARFADHAQATLESPEVRDLAADKLTGQVIDQIDPDLIAVRPVLDAASAALIDTTAFKRLFRSAVLQAHRAAVERDLGSAVLVLANVGVLVEQSLRKLSPEIARQIPEGLDAKLVKVADGSFESDVATIAAKTGTLSWVLPLVALLLMATGFAVAPNRRRALNHCGIALAGSGAGLTVAYAFARSLLIHRAADGIDRDAAEAIWHEFMGGAFVLSVSMATAGAALAAAAAGNLRPADVDSRVRQILARVAHPPPAALPRALWALGLIAMGALALLDPVGAVKGLMFVAGFYLVFRGVNELIAIAMPPVVEPAATAEGKAPNFARRFGSFAAAVAVICVAAAALAAATIGEEGLQRLGVIKDTRSCNGAETLCSKRLPEIALAATHNSMSDKTYPGGWLFPEQDGPVSEQLAYGVRALMLDVYYGFPGTRVYTDGDLSSPDVRDKLKSEFGKEFVAAADRIRRTLSKPERGKRRMYLCHGFCELGATPIEETLGQVRTFLEDNPREVMMIVFQDYVPTRELWSELEKGGIADYAYRGPVDGRWPRIGEMIDQNQRLVLLNENNLSPAVPWIHGAFDVMQETPFAFSSKSALTSAESCVPGRGGDTNELFLMNHWISTPPAARPSNARVANARELMRKRIRRCERSRGRPANLVAVDFYAQGDLMAVVDELNAGRTGGE
ncbi:MAG: hypothetical protein HY827_08445 [Actinobacteria bacterium]|nr:hypothetical protein [Actinomycetota bacterium]